MSFKEKIQLQNVPKHIAVIMDGNGRWAKQQGEERIFGHMNGVESVREVLKAASEIGVKHLTLYAFSTENWNRPKEEVEALMNLLVQTIASETEELNENDVKLSAIGDLDNLPASCRHSLFEAIEKTKANKRINLILALSYSARWEMTNAIRKIASDVKCGKLKEEEIKEDTINGYLTTSNIPDPELLIRTSGECRISNFLLWQCAYTEFYFTPVLWPDFKKETLFEAVYDYQQRERRFGKVSEQLQH
jgi:undecaprenyl diphosphate synthase